MMNYTHTHGHTHTLLLRYFLGDRFTRDLFEKYAYFVCYLVLSPSALYLRVRENERAAVCESVWKPHFVVLLEMSYVF